MFFPYRFSSDACAFRGLVDLMVHFYKKNLQIPLSPFRFKNILSKRVFDSSILFFVIEIEGRFIV